MTTDYRCFTDPAVAEVANEELVVVSTFDSLIKALESNEENLQISPMPTLIFYLRQRQKTALK